MSTVKHTLDPDAPWKQLTSGNETQPVLIQVTSGGMLFCESATLPASDAAAHHLTSGPQSFIAVTAPTILWVKGLRELSDSIVVVTGSDVI
ncbi:hypothetical protein A3X38_18065 [Salmonella enterica subsp. enterica serovar Florida]|nr:hypothetical protein [Salmonella enterica subsp. enterica]EBW8394639.1 hypothetical protein [Salmonella enterica subsp. enterica serovar Florida]EKY9205815.1 hypothetical protein [Salmonella enterica]